MISSDLAMKHILVACWPATRPLFSKFRRAFKLVRMEDRLAGAIQALTIQPEIVLSEIVLPDQEIWSLITAVRTGKLCQADTPIVGLTFGERTLAMEHLAMESNVLLFDDPALDGLVEFVAEVLREKEKRLVKPRVLVIDDDSAILQEIQYLLSPWFQTEGCLSGHEGIRAWMEKFHDLIVLDLELPDMHGNEVLRVVRQMRQDQPILILTAHMTEKNVIGFSLRGAKHSADKELLYTSPGEILMRCREAIHRGNLQQLDDRERQHLEYLRLTRAAGDYLFSGHIQAARMLMAQAMRLAQAQSAPVEDDDFGV